MATATKTLPNVTCPVWHKENGKAADFEDHSGYVTFDQLRKETDGSENLGYGNFVLDEIEKNPLAAVISALVSAGDAIETEELMGISPSEAVRNMARAILLGADRR